MKSDMRRKIILDMVRQEGSVTLAQLQERLSDVAEITLRRDLEALDRERQLVRIRGGAKSLEAILGVYEDSYANRLVNNAEEKHLIAQKAVRLFRPKTSIFLDSGSTAFCLAALMPDEECVITTPGITCAMELSKLQKPKLRMLGGVINKNSFSVNGDVSVAEAADLNFNIAFLGATGYIPGVGFVTSVTEDYMLKKTVVENSQKVVMLVDSTKVGKLSTYTVAPLGKVDTVVTDGRFREEDLAVLRDAGITVL